MTNEFFVTGLLLVTLIVGAALLPISVLLRPNHKQQIGIGVLSGVAALLVAVLHLHGPLARVSFVPPSILASVSFLFGPVAGGVATAISLLKLVVHSPYGWWISAGLSVSLWGLGSLMWQLQRRMRVNFWLMLSLLVLLVPLFIAPWAALSNPFIFREWNVWEVIPWRYVIGMVLLCGAMGLLMSRARVLLRLRQRERELHQALRASGGGRWEWSWRSERLSYQGSFFRDFGLEDSPDDDALSVLKATQSRETLDALRARVNKEDAKRLKMSIERLRSGTAQHFHEEFRIRDKTGKWRCVIARGSVVERDASGACLRLSGMLLDVTEHHAMADALHLSEVKYTTFFNTLPDPAGIVRMSDGCFVDVNPAMARLFQQPASELIGKRAEEIGLRMDEADRDRLLFLLQEDGQVHTSQMKISVGNTLIPGVVSARRTHVDGESCLVFVFHDMTHANAVQESLRTTNDLLREASWLGRLGSWEGVSGVGVTYWSDVCCEIHGVPAGTPAPLDYVERFIAPEWQEKVRASNSLPRDDSAVWDMEFEIVRADGRRV
ncbi:PAS domain-containing protein [Diaphorobacter aerolatus]|uniref:PAS domain-containing protein n=1 Tax=Diaphorobacter aerolatus TaxID=1288495 RepID=UPI001D020EE5|nr:PAS domain-containing protein [Diaphorobacter aerolatus]